MNEMNITGSGCQTKLLNLHYPYVFMYILYVFLCIEYKIYVCWVYEQENEFCIELILCFRDSTKQDKVQHIRF